MASITTAMPTSEKAEFMQAAHCYNGVVTPTGTLTSGSQTVTVMSSTAGIALGMSVSNANLPTLTVVESVVNSTSITVSRTATGTASGTTLTITGDAFYIALIKQGYTGTYGASNVNYTDLTGNSDEVSGTGYTAGGLLMTQVTPTTNGTGANTNFSPNPSWSSATIDSQGAMIYNKTSRLFGTSGTNTVGSGRCNGVYSFGGEQKVTSGTFTILMPTAAPATAVIAIQ